jgi:hypothetical protein
VNARQISVEQVSALTQSKLKSEIDLSLNSSSLSRPFYGARFPFNAELREIGSCAERRAPQRRDVNIRVLNGRLFSARRTEADPRAQALRQQVKDFENRIRAAKSPGSTQTRPSNAWP